MDTKKIIDINGKEISIDDITILTDAKYLRGLVTNSDVFDGQLLLPTPVRMPANYVMPDPRLHKLIKLEAKRSKWRKELKDHEDYLAWFHKEEPYMNSLEFQAYDHAAQESEAAIKKLKNQLRYARR